MSLLDVLFGSGSGQRLIILGTLAFYAYLVVFRPSAAREHRPRVHHARRPRDAHRRGAVSDERSRDAPAREDRLDGLLGRSARLRDVVAAGLIAKLIPGGPYAVYPVIVSVQESGASDPAVLTMLVGYGLIGVGRVPFGLVFFSPAVVTLRLAVAAAATVVVGVILFAVGNAFADRSASS